MPSLNALIVLAEKLTQCGHQDVIRHPVPGTLYCHRCGAMAWNGEDWHRPLLAIDAAVALLEPPKLDAGAPAKASAEDEPTAPLAVDGLVGVDGEPWHAGIVTEAPRD